MNNWTPEEFEFLYSNYETIGAHEVAERLGRTVYAIRRKWCVRSDPLRVPLKRWTKQELDFVDEFYSIKGAEFVGGELGRSASSVKHKASRRRILVDPEQERERSLDRRRKSQIKRVEDGVTDIHAWK